MFNLVSCAICLPSRFPFVLVGWGRLRGTCGEKLRGKGKNSNGSLVFGSCVLTPAFLEVWLHKPTEWAYVLSLEAKGFWRKQKATEQMWSYGICLIYPLWSRNSIDLNSWRGSWFLKKDNNEKNPREKHKKRKVKGPKIMSSRMWPNLSNLSTVVVE